MGPGIIKTTGGSWGQRRVTSGKNTKRGKENSITPSAAAAEEGEEGGGRREEGGGRREEEEERGWVKTFQSCN